MIMIKYDLLVYLGLLVVVVVIGAAVVVLWRTTDANFETSRLRFAAATSTGLFVIAIFVIILYFVDPTGPGKDIFVTVFPTLVALAGAIIGSFYSRGPVETRREPSSDAASSAAVRSP